MCNSLNGSLLNKSNFPQCNVQNKLHFCLVFQGVEELESLHPDNLVLVSLS